MILKNKFVSKFEKISKNYTNVLSFDQIFSKMISRDKQHQDELNRLINNQSTLCGKTIKIGDLAFTCLTCSREKPHLYCSQCFDMELHQGTYYKELGHKCFMSEEQGFCDCGDETLLDQKGFCMKHQGFKDFNLDEELNKISESLREKITNFFSQLCLLYLEKIQKVQEKSHQYTSTIIQIYHFTILLELKGLQQQLQDSFIGIQDYYKSFQECYYLYKIFFRTINWLITDKLPMIILLSRILLMEVKHNQSIIANIFDFQAFLETQGPKPNFYVLKQILNTFQKDYYFKHSFNKIMTKKYEKFSIFIPGLKIYLQSQVNQLLIKLQLIKNSKLTIEEELEQEWVSFFQIQSQEFKVRSQISKQFFQSKLMSYNYKYGKEDLTYDFFEIQHFKIALQASVQHFNILHQISFTKKTSAEQFGRVFYQHEYKYIKDVLELQIKNSFGYNDYEKLSKIQLSNNEIIQMTHHQFLHSIIIEEFKSIKPRKKLLIESEYYMQWKAIYHDLGYYIAEISAHIHLFQECFKQDFQEKNNIYQDNLLRILLLQCYQAIKQYKNSEKSIVNKIIEAYNKYIKGNLLTAKQIINRYSRILLLAIKCDQLLDKIFIFLLGYFYNFKQFNKSREFLMDIQQLFGENKEELNQQLYKILERCLVSFISMEYNKNEFLRLIYQGIKKTLFSICSYDIVFIQFYLFLYKQEGLNQVRKIISQIELLKNHPEIFKTNSKQIDVERLILRRIFGGDLDMLNIYGIYFQELPPDLYLSFAKLFANLYVDENYVHYEFLKEYFVALKVNGALISHNNYKNFINVCTLDRPTLQFCLNQCFKPTFDKNILSQVPEYQEEVLDNLIQKNSNPQLIHFGNGINWDIQYYQQQSPLQRKILKEILEFYCQQSEIQNNILVLKELKYDRIMVSQLLHTQIVASHYFQKEIFEQNGSQFIDDLKILLKQIKERKIKQILNILIDFIESLLPACQDSQEIQKQKQIRPSNKKKYQQKFQLKQQQTQYQKNLVEIEIENDSKDEDENCCAACKEQFKDSNIIAPILILMKPFITSFQLLSLSIENFLSSNFGTNIGITVCKHRYHNNCLQKYFNSLKQECGDIDLEWLRLQCPACKNSCNFFIPVNTIMNQDEIQTYIMIFQAFCNEEHSLEIDISIIFYLLLLDLFIQLFENQQEFEIFKKYQVMQSLIVFLQFLYQQNEAKDSKQYFQNISNESYTLSIIREIEKFVRQQVTQQQFQDEIFKLLKLCGNQKIRELMQRGLNIKPYVEILDIQDSQNEELLFFSNIFNSVSNQILNLLGKNFDVFHKKYFPKGCFKCGFFNSDQRKSFNSYLCLFCGKMFCLFDCSKEQNQLQGNLNLHAANQHNGTSVYLKINSGDCILVVNPITALDIRCCFCNKASLKVSIQTEQLDWENFEIINEEVQDLTKMIVQREYLKAIKFQLEQDENLDYFGRY